jgi:hypothetical protein
LKIVLENKNDDTSIQPLDNDDLNEIMKIHEKKEMADLSSVVLGCISAVLLSLILITVNLPVAEARCPEVTSSQNLIPPAKNSLEDLIHFLKTL